MSVHWFEFGRGFLVGVVIGMAGFRNDWSLRRRLLSIPVGGLLGTALWWHL